MLNGLVQSAGAARAAKSFPDFNWMLSRLYVTLSWIDAGAFTKHINIGWRCMSEVFELQEHNLCMYYSLSVKPRTVGCLLA